MVHGLPSSQPFPANPLMCVQLADEYQDTKHASIVQASPSSQFPLTDGIEQNPTALQTPTWHQPATSHAVPVATYAKLQLPSAFIFSIVHSFPSSQDLGTCQQPLCAALHPSTVNGSPSLQLPAGMFLHTPALSQLQLPQASGHFLVASRHQPVAHALVSPHPSVHVLPSAMLTTVHPLARSHASLVHGLASSQMTGVVPAMHLPFKHLSPLRHSLPSAQGPLFMLCTQLPPGPQLSVVQLLPSSQLSEITCKQLKALVQKSRVQARPSSQSMSCATHASPTQ